jgi:hypothetical protein
VEVAVADSDVSLTTMAVACSGGGVWRQDFFFFLLFFCFAYCAWTRQCFFAERQLKVNYSPALSTPAVSPLSLVTFSQCVGNKHTTNVFVMHPDSRHTVKVALPCKTLPSGIWHTPWRKMHNKEFVVRFLTIVVRFRHTAKMHPPIVRHTLHTIFFSEDTLFISNKMDVCYMHQS